MKGRDEVSARKLRGGYYTPPDLVRFCVARATAAARRPLLEWLEPGAGDGAFVRGLDVSGDARVTCVEIEPTEAAKCRAALSDAGLTGEVVEHSVFPWLLSEPGRSFDAVVGNPPYVRYQFLSAEDRAAAQSLIEPLGLELQGVSNAWILFALLAMSRVRLGGAWAMVLPSELLATVSAGQFRRVLVRDFASIRVDMFARSTFADLLQDVIVVSGRKAAQSAMQRRVTFVEHRGRTTAKWTREVRASAEPWMQMLLSAREQAALDEARDLFGMMRLGDAARIQVAVVTGANAYFTIPDEIRGRYELDPWAVPLLPKTAHCPGLVFKKKDFAQTRRSGARAWLLDFGEERPSPSAKAQEYLALGEQQGIPSRYKCRIRTPWYRVPHIVTGSLMLTKRAHQHHRLLMNSAGVATTDTVYRGRTVGGHRSRDLVAGFHNSLTLLTAELEGRTYGGGVLELIPSEIARLMVPMIDGMGSHLAELDRVSRSAGGQKDEDDRLVDATDAIVARELPGLAPLLGELRDARNRLRTRRFTGA